MKTPAVLWVAEKATKMYIKKIKISSVFFHCPYGNASFSLLVLILKHQCFSEYLLKSLIVASNENRNRAFHILFPFKTNVAIEI